MKRTHEDYVYDKDVILSDISKARKSLQLYQKCLETFGRDWLETIELETEWLKKRTLDLIKLKQEFKDAEWITN